ncbi:hypothetical protein NYO98_07090 [Nocardioides sp. STR2]|jgi:hypothetical protein|uniref:Uncharacterized protein n=1 Tax=Nocardioides pini TaxID=2975053 RepID=A0ABT4CD22_9ACTN|nr:hypothetical protein [Nocardioides pini]MCY4726039.1 hypothetical protein [Nocardioides pini]
MQATITDIDPFDLPEWLGTGDVVWRADEGLQTGHLVRGRLTADPAGRQDGQDGQDSGSSQEIVCDLLAVDEAYPAPVVDDATRLRVHQAWRHGQVVIGEHGSRLVLAVPGTRFGPELVLDALGRLARAVGARAERYAALLRLG